jgi:hypothetical protein
MVSRTIISFPALDRERRPYRSPTYQRGVNRIFMLSSSIPYFREKSIKL